jgi:predicted nucleic acid-binding protein
MIEPLQPVHWAPEVVAVINRLDPDIVDEVIDLLDAMEFATVDKPEIYKREGAIARETNQHVFDTLCHAVALQHEVVLVTANTKYFKKAEKLGRLVSLNRWEYSV